MRADLEAINDVHKQNYGEIIRGFALNDVHIHVFRRITRDLVSSLVKIRKLQVDGDHTLTPNDFDVKIAADGSLNLRGYYNEYSNVEGAAGEKAVVAVSLWAQGVDPEEAVMRATVEVELPEEELGPDEDSDQYEIHHFGGTSGKSSNEQVAPSTQEGG